MEDTLKNKVSGAKLDFDENDKPFHRLSLYLQEPYTKDEIYMEWPKTESKEVLIEKEDGIYVKEEDVVYLQKLWQVEKNLQRLLLLAKQGEKGVTVPEEWWDEVQAVPYVTAMWDDVFVNKQKVKIDYNITCEGEEGEKVKNLIAKITEKFPNEKDFYMNDYTVIGCYLDNHIIRPPYKSQNTITLYYMYYDKADYKKLLEEYNVQNRDLYSYVCWYGHKYDLDAEERLLKTVIYDTEATSNFQKYPSSFILRPELPVCTGVYFAKIYNADGIEADEYDVFFSTTTDIMKEYCENNNLDFPLPEDRINDHCWVYGLVYDKNTLEIKQVKAYIKVAQDYEEFVKAYSQRLEWKKK